MVRRSSADHNPVPAARRVAGRDGAIKQRDMAIHMLAEWCVAIYRNGAGWDAWDDCYKDAAYRPGPLRQRLDKAIEQLKSQYE